MLDVHSTYDATGSTDTVVTEAVTGAIPANDGATTIGLSPYANAVLLCYGVHVVAAAQALVSLGLQGNNLVDPSNKLVDTATGTDTAVLKAVFLQLGYAKGANLVTYANEAAGKTASFKIDWISGVGSTVPGSLVPPGLAQYSQTSGALTAGVYGTLAFNPTTTPPIGTYAILGVRASALTFGAVIRFAHTDFAGTSPGFPIVDSEVGATTPANYGFSPFSAEEWQGFQFVKMGMLTGLPCCPVFRIQGQSTGLNMQILDTATDSPSITLNLMKIA